MSVEATVSLTSFMPGGSSIAPSNIGRLSDGNLVVVSYTSSQFRVYRSTDGGSSWALDFTTPLYLSTAIFNACFIQNDYIYLLSSAALKHVVKRIDYASGVFSLGVDWTIAFPALAASSILYNGCFSREVGGRLWCVRKAYDNSDLQTKVQIVYSDDNGISWSSVNTLVSAGSGFSGAFLIMLENNQIVVYNRSSTTYTRERLHTDPPTSWTTETSRLTGLATNYFPVAAVLATNPPKKAMIITNDSPSAGALRGVRVTETGSSLSFSSIGTASIGTSGSAISGRSNGWRVVSLRNADASHIRVHLIGESDSSWPSSTDVSIANAFNDYSDISTITSMPNPKDDGSDFTVWAHVANQDIFSRTDVLGQTFSRIVPISWRFLPGFFRSIPISWNGFFASYRKIPIAWLSGYVFFYRPIPASWLGQIAIKRAFPTMWHGPIPFGMTRSVAVAWSALKSFQRNLPINWSVIVVEDWLVITNPEGDSWAVLPVSPEADSWSPLDAPESDVWV